MCVDCHCRPPLPTLHHFNHSPPWLFCSYSHHRFPFPSLLKVSACNSQTNPSPHQIQSPNPSSRPLHPKPQTPYLNLYYPSRLHRHRQATKTANNSPKLIKPKTPQAFSPCTIQSPIQTSQQQPLMQNQFCSCSAYHLINPPCPSQSTISDSPPAISQATSVNSAKPDYPQPPPCLFSFNQITKLQNPQSATHHRLHPLKPTSNQPCFNPLHKRIKSANTNPNQTSQPSLPKPANRKSQNPYPHHKLHSPKSNPCCPCRDHP